MSREALVLLVCCCDFRDGAERLIPSKSLGNAVIRAFPGLLCILRMCAPRRAVAVVRPRGREKSADRRRRILISRLLIIRVSVPRRKSPFPAYFKGFPAVSPLIPPYPAFLKYPVSPHAGFSAALAASAGIIGCIIPPSIPFVNYALITGESVSDLFAAGVVPGILMGVVLCIWTIILANKYGWGSRKKGISLRGVWKAFCSAIYAILMPVIILGGIYSGLFTPTEAAAVAAVYGAIVSLFIYRGIKLRDMLDIGFEAVRTSCMIMFICATANIFSFVVTRQQVPAKLSSLILGVTDNWVVILLIINVILLINGCFMETTASTYIYTPILFPLISALGYNPIQFGVVMVMNLTLGLITPPLGINLFVAQGVDRRVSFGAQVKQVMPMFILLVVVLMLVTYIPGLSLCLIGGGN